MKQQKVKITRGTVFTVQEPYRNRKTGLTQERGVSYVSLGVLKQNTKKGILYVCTAVKRNCIQLDGKIRKTTKVRFFPVQKIHSVIGHIFINVPKVRHQDKTSIAAKWLTPRQEPSLVMRTEIQQKSFTNFMQRTT